MKKAALIELYSPGIVLFDPAVLSQFLEENTIADSNVFDAFLQDEALGWAAIRQGIVVPMYQIPERAYSVFLLDSIESEAGLPQPMFSYSGFSLKVCSGLVVVADLNALLDWEREFFLNYQVHYDTRLPGNDYIELDAGLYDLTVNGYVALPQPLSDMGYGIEVTLKNEMSEMDEGLSIDDMDFDLL